MGGCFTAHLYILQMVPGGALDAFFLFFFLFSLFFARVVSEPHKAAGCLHTVANVEFQHTAAFGTSSSGYLRRMSLH